jgi:hypothetical protein
MSQKPGSGKISSGIVGEERREAVRICGVSPSLAWPSLSCRAISPQAPTAGTRSPNLILLLVLIAFFPSLSAYEQSALRVIIIEGEGAINNVMQRTARVPVVQIEDENHRPVTGATVKFRLPETGPGGSFPNGARFLVVTTDSTGRAAANGLKPNRLAGSFLIRVTANVGELTTEAVVAQTNVSAGAAAAAGSSWVRRLTGWTSLLHGKREAPGYGLYSYLLLAAPPTDLSRPRYAAAVAYFLTQIPDIQSFSNDRTPSQLNISYLLLTAEAASPMSVDWVLDHYDYARSQVLLSAIQGSHPQGPYVVSTAGPLSGRTSIDKNCLYQDLSSVPDRIIPLWLKEFTEQAAQKCFWEQRNVAQFLLRLRTSIASISDTPVNQVTAMVTWLKKSQLQSRK